MIYSNQNKRGQLDFPIIGFVVVVIGLIMLAPIMLKTFNSIQDGLSPALGNVTVGGATAQANFDGVMNPLVNFWDEIVIAAFAFSVILLLISSFLIDTHPIWVILYVFLAMMLVLFIPDMLQGADSIYGSSQFGLETSQLSFMDNLRTHFAEVVIGLIILTGIIIYGKISFFPSQSGSGR